MKTPITYLQEFAVKKKMALPTYELIVSSTDSNDNSFHFKVRVGNIDASGIGRSKKEAKHDAAYKAITKLANSGACDFPSSEVPPPDVPSSAASTPAQPSTSAEHHIVGQIPTVAQPSSLAKPFNAIGALLEACTRNKLPSPQFFDIPAEGSSHSPQFSFECQVSSMRTKGTAFTKKQAKQMAASSMLIRIEEVIPGLKTNTERVKSGTKTKGVKKLNNLIIDDNDDANNNDSNKNGGPIPIVSVPPEGADGKMKTLKRANSPQNMDDTSKKRKGETPKSSKVQLMMRRMAALLKKQNRKLSTSTLLDSSSETVDSKSAINSTPSEILSNVAVDIPPIQDGTISNLTNTKSKKELPKWSPKHTLSEEDQTVDPMSNSKVDPFLDHLKCSICSEMFITAVTLNCSHSFCQFCIKKWRQKDSTCPVCRQKITSENATLVLDQCVEKVMESSTEEMKKQWTALKTAREKEQADTKSSTSNSSHDEHPSFSDDDEGDDEFNMFDDEDSNDDIDAEQNSIKYLFNTEAEDQYSYDDPCEDDDFDDLDVDY